MNSITAPYPPGFAKQLRDRIGRAIEAHSANEVPAVCVRYGMRSGEVSEAFSGKYKYVTARLLQLETDEVVKIAREIVQDAGDEDISKLLLTIEPKSSLPSSSVSARHRVYYAERNGIGNAGGRLDLSSFIILFKNEYVHLEQSGYFVEHFGFWCVDVPDKIDGCLGSDINSRMLFSINKNNLWPIVNQCDNYSEDDLFSVIEFLFDHISKPLIGTRHTYADCGMHWETFSQTQGQEEFRATINVLLERYGDGWELSSSGEIMERAPTGAEGLLTTSLPHSDNNIQGRVQSAITKFRKRQSTVDDRRDAVRDLADTLEYLRPQVETVLVSKDASDLYNIANNFGVRHHNPRQKIEYDLPIWLSWMFYYYLATIHAVVRLIEKSGQKIH